MDVVYFLDEFEIEVLQVVVQFGYIFLQLRALLGHISHRGAVWVQRRTLHNFLFWLFLSSPLLHFCSEALLELLDPPLELLHLLGVLVKIVIYLPL